MTRLAVYHQAIEELEQAIAEFDQFRSSLKDCGLAGLNAGGYRKPSDWELFDDMESLLDRLRAVTCDDCGQRVDQHDDAACEYGRWNDELRRRGTCRKS